MVKKEIFKKIASRYKLKLLLLFGSRVTGNVHEESDFDIAYLSAKNLSLKDEARLTVDLSPIVKSEKIDLVNLKTASPLLLYGITGEAEILFTKDDLLFPSLRAYAFKKYIEGRPLYELKRQRVLEKVR